jgi:hypothetical protein
VGIAKNTKGDIIQNKNTDEVTIMENNTWKPLKNSGN